MKEKTYGKAMDRHGERLCMYGERLHGLVADMLDGGCTVGDAMALLEKEKLYLYVSVHLDARGDAMAETIGSLLGDDGR